MDKDPVEQTQSLEQITHVSFSAAHIKKGDCAQMVNMRAIQLLTLGSHMDKMGFVTGKELPEANKFKHMFNPPVLENFVQLAFTDCGCES